MISAPSLGPVIAGLKLTSTVQLPPAARAGPQSLLWEKSMPDVRMSVIVNTATPPLTSVMAFGELIALTA